MEEIVPCDCARIEVGLDVQTQAGEVEDTPKEEEEETKGVEGFVRDASV